MKKIFVVCFIIAYTVPLFSNGNSEKKSTEQLTKTETGTAIFINSIDQIPYDDGKIDNTGDVRTSAGWLYSDIFTVYPDISYSLKATVVVGSASDVDKDEGGDRVRMYLVPVTNTENTFTLEDAGGTALISVDAAEEINQPFIDLSSGDNTVDIVFTSSETTKMRIVFEKGQLDWEDVNNSKMAGQEVSISNVVLDYVYE